VRPVFVALTAEGLATARRAAAAVGGEVHASAKAEKKTFSQGEKADAPGSGSRPARGQAARPDEGVRSLMPRRRTPSPVAVGDTLSPRERVGGRGDGADCFYADFAAHVRNLFEEGTPIVGVCAAGILIRVLAPLLSGKRSDPPVLAMSEAGESVVPLLGGHSGANELAVRIADALGTHAAVTTAGDSRFGVALDRPPEGWTLANPDDAKDAMAALLGGAKARLEGPASWLAQSRIPFSDDGAVRLIATTRTVGFRDDASAGSELALVYHPRRLSIGIGCERGADLQEAIALLEETLAGAGYAPASVALVASLDLKADEPAVLAAAEHLGVPARFFASATLEKETPRLENPSETVFREVGCHGVAEAAALASSGPAGVLVVAKRKSARVTCAIAEAPDVIDASKVGRARGRLAIVGIGPGSADWLTPEAKRLLQTSDAAVGYSLYLDLVAPLIADAERFDFPLGAEEARVRRALALAGEGRSVALVSSGDPGVYAMATLAFECLDAERAFSHGEKVAARGSGWRPARGQAARPDEGVPSLMRRRRTPSPVAFGDTLSPLERVGAAARRVEIVVAPGISAMQAAAARAGAPLGHDFCAISLSDLLTPWEAIEARLRAAAEGDLVVALYNPVSTRRREQLARAKGILLRHRPPETPVVIARNLGREGESVTTVPLSELSADMVDMLTLVMVGASTTRQVDVAGQRWTYTPRGYGKKRNADAAE
jgi:cobalt-precorrin 5A hydrolase/precorrin-3B C17-methyltransferase